MSVKEPVQDQEALLKALKVISALGTVVDTHKNVPFAGKKGREKYKDTKFSNADSVFDNAVEGTDVMENIGFEPGAAHTYALGNIYDVFNPVDIALLGATKMGKLAGKAAKFFNASEGTTDALVKAGKMVEGPAKVLTPIETLMSKGGEKLVEKSLPKYIEKKLRNEKDIPMAGQIAKEAIETGASKNLSNPKKSLEIIRGKSERIRKGGSDKFPIYEMKKEDGTLDKIGQVLQENVKREAKTAKKVNKGAIYHKEMDKLKAKNAAGIEYRKSVEEKDRVLRDALSPFEKKERIEVEPPAVPTMPKFPAKKTEKVAAKVDKAEELLGDNVIQLPPPVPGKQGSVEEAIAALQNSKNTDKLKETMEKNWEAQLEAARPKISKHVDEVGVEVPLDELWAKKVALRKELKESTFSKPMHEWTEKDKTLEALADDIDEEILKRMSIPGQDIHRGANQKYSAQSKLANIFEDQLQSEAGSGIGRAARVGTESAVGGVTNPATAGRIVKEIYDATVGPKRRVQLGNVLQDRRITTPLSQFMTEMTEIPYDHPYMKDETERTEEAAPAPSDLGDGWEEIPSASVETPDTGRSPASMASEEPTPDNGWEEVGMELSPQAQIPEGGEPIHQKMDHVLSPEKPHWDPYVNEQVLNTFLPRDSKRILANPQALMAKMQQVAPNQVPVLQEMLDNDPESLAEAGPKLALMFPAVFEKDKYNAFDGKIIDPMMQQKFLKDLADDESMDSIQKANIAMKLSRGESIHS